MGVSIITRGYNAESAFPSGGPFLPFDVPVRSSLVAWHIPGASAAKTLYNFAPGGAQGCSLVGDPIYSSGYVSLLSRANAAPAYIQTPYLETDSMFIAAVCRFPGANDTTANRGVLISNQATKAAADNTTAFATPLQIAPNATGSLFGTVMRGASTATAVQAGATLTTTLTSWMLLTMEVPQTGVNRLINQTTGQSGVASTSALHQPGIDPLRIGSSYTTGNGGQVDIAALALWSSVPDSTGIASIVAAMRANVATKGITV